jgi:hypothetical protein
MIDPSWEGRKWTLLASVGVVAGILGLMWWLTGGCESRQPAANPNDSMETYNRTMQTLQAMQDPNVMELAFRIACFYEMEKRLPASLDELRQNSPAAGLPPPPTVTTRGAPLGYERGADRRYALVLGPEAGPGGAAQELRLPQEVPADRPTKMVPEALRLWWDLQYYKTMAEKMRGRLSTPPDHQE